LNLFSSYNGPYTESGNDDELSLSRTNSLKKQHVHWPQLVHLPNTTILNESPSSHRRPLNSNLSHIIQTAFLPAGSTVCSTNTNQLLTPSKDFTSTAIDCN